MASKLFHAVTLFILSCPWIDAQPLKVLHLSFHRGCINDFEYVAQQLSLDLTSVFILEQPSRWLDGETTGNAIYNIGHIRAEKIWNKHKDFFQQFDAIITSDIAPLSRIFLQNGWKKPLIIWICNRFDYYDGASLDCRFPDPEYYELFRNALHQLNVTVVAYTSFEHFYAQQKNVYTGTLTIKPCAAPNNIVKQSSIPNTVNKSETFFIPQYHNDTLFCDLEKICHNLGIPAYRGRYNGPGDLKDFKGIIHIPYAWSNLALFENLQNGMPYFIPSPKFLLELSKQPNFWFQSKEVIRSMLPLSEWYCQENRLSMTYFDSWEDLIKKIHATDFSALKKRIQICGEIHRKNMLARWKSVFEKYL